MGDRPLPTPGEPTDDVLADAGAWYFRRNCAACHMVGGEQELIGPNLGGVTERREMAWIAAMIRRPDSMIMADSIAASLFAEYQVPMANRQLDEARVRAILEFLWRADRGPGSSETLPGEGGGAEGVSLESESDGRAGLPHAPGARSDPPASLPAPS